MQDPSLYYFIVLLFRNSGLQIYTYGTEGSIRYRLHTAHATGMLWGWSASAPWSIQGEAQPLSSFHDRTEEGSSWNPCQAVSKMCQNHDRRPTGQNTFCPLIPWGKGNSRRSQLLASMCHYISWGTRSGFTAAAYKGVSGIDMLQMKSNLSRELPSIRVVVPNMGSKEQHP